MRIPFGYWIVTGPAAHLGCVCVCVSVSISLSLSLSRSLCRAHAEATRTRKAKGELYVGPGAGLKSVVP